MLLRRDREGKKSIKELKEREKCYVSLRVTRKG